MSGFAQSGDYDISLFVYSHDSDTAIVNSKSKPSFRRKLKSTTDKVTNHIAMTNQDINRIVLLLHVCTMNVFSKRCLYSRTFYEKVLKKMYK